MRLLSFYFTLNSTPLLKIATSFEMWKKKNKNLIFDFYFLFSKMSWILEMCKRRMIVEHFYERVTGTKIEHQNNEVAWLSSLHNWQKTRSLITYEPHHQPIEDCTVCIIEMWSNTLLLFWLCSSILSTGVGDSIFGKLVVGFVYFKVRDIFEKNELQFWRIVQKSGLFYIF